MAFALSYLRYDLSSLTIFLVRGQTVQDAHPPDKHIVRCDPQVQVVGRFVALSANYDPRFLKKERLVLAQGNRRFAKPRKTWDCLGVTFFFFSYDILSLIARLYLFL